MKKGFTMIELIFVIVVLGILTTIAIPLLHGTRGDAWITTTAANLRTLISDINAYYVVKEEFGTRPNFTKWKDITNVPLKDHGGDPIADQSVFQEVYLYIDDTWCIGVALRDRLPPLLPFYIQFHKNPDASELCEEVLAAEPIRAYTESAILEALPGTMAID